MSRFEQLGEAICYQQLAGKAAEAIWSRVRVLVDGSFTPDAVLAVGYDALRGAGRNRRLNREAEIDDLLERPLRWIHDAEELANAITMFTCNNGATTRAPVQEALKCEFMQGVANGRSRDTQ